MPCAKQLKSLDFFTTVCAKRWCGCDQWVDLWKNKMGVHRRKASVKLWITHSARAIPVLIKQVMTKAKSAVGHKHLDKKSKIKAICLLPWKADKALSQRSNLVETIDFRKIFMVYFFQVQPRILLWKYFTNLQLKIWAFDAKAKKH